MKKMNRFVSASIPSLLFAAFLGCGSDNSSLFDPFQQLDGASKDVAPDGADAAVADARVGNDASIVDVDALTELQP